MNSTEITALLLWLKFRNFYRRNKPTIFLALMIVGIVVVWIFLRQRQGEASLNAGPEWNDWNPVH